MEFFLQPNHQVQCFGLLGYSWISRDSCAETLSIVSPLFCQMTSDAEDSEAPDVTSRRRFIKYAAMGAAATGLLASGALSPIAFGEQQVGPSAFQSLPSAHSNGINVVLVHGVWADATSYNGVIPLLLNAGYAVSAPQLPLTTHLADDVNAAIGVIQQTKGPTVLVGHSYGGAIITNAGAGFSNVIGLVYCSAFAPDLGEALGQFPPGPGLANTYPVVYPNNFGTFLFFNQQQFRASFCADVSPPQSDIMAVVQKPGNINLFGDPTTAVAWKTIPSWYLISGKDQLIPPSLQQTFATRMNATVTTVKDSSHASIVSHPETVFDLIQKAAGQKK
jgi:pimeloyl-ACP methyl ester carboxylesterase